MRSLHDFVHFCFCFHSFVHFSLLLTHLCHSSVIRKNAPSFVSLSDIVIFDIQNNHINPFHLEIGPIRYHLNLFDLFTIFCFFSSLNLFISSITLHSTLPCIHSVGVLCIGRSEPFACPYSQQEQPFIYIISQLHMRCDLSH